ncbi:MAG: hypothetical protein PHC46_04850 [Clostridia bacterium]|nr:hypothetical protein [Clostridia bacterium]
MQLGVYEIVYIVLGVCALFYVIMFVFLKRHNKKETIEKTGIDEKGGVRYTIADEPVLKEDEVTGEVEANLTFDKKDIMLRRGFKYIVGENNKIKAGKYTLLTTEEAINEFNIRRNGYVRSYEHNSNVILDDGEDLTAINISVILR